MSNQSLKSKATSGFIWNAVEQLLVIVGQLVIGIVLARLLMPEDFGLIGMLSIFIAISQVFIQSGMGSGLIQKQDRTEQDFSTVFIFNLVVSIVCYGILFFTAPLIASFYEMPVLVQLTRVLGLTLIINSFAVVQRTKLEIDVDFKTLSKVNVVALIVGGGLGIVAALFDYGVWSLVIQTLTISAVTAVGLWSIGNWSLSLIFSRDSFKKLFGYGSKILAAGIYGKTLQEIYNLAIGKAYAASELGYFMQAKTLSNKPSGLLYNVLQKVSFPILSSLQNNEEKMVNVFSRMIKMSAFITFPSMTLLAILAEPIVLVLLTDKWLPAVPLLQWLCFAKIVHPMGAINLNVLNAIGRSDLFLKVDLAKFPVIVGALIITIPISIEAVVIGQFVGAIISYVFHVYMPGRLFNYGLFEQVKDMIPMMISSTIMAIITYLSVQYVSSELGKIIIGLIVASLSYLLVSYLLKINELKEIFNIVKERL